MTNDAINSLRNQAYQVYQPWPARAGARLSARGVASRLWPYIYAASTRHSETEMRTACAFLAATQPSAWLITAETALEVSLASTAAELLRESTEDNVRAALAFWAAETDPAVWQAVIS
jgi:hypothetical protein